MGSIKLPKVEDRGIEESVDIQLITVIIFGFVLYLYYSTRIMPLTIATPFNSFSGISKGL